MHILSLFNQRSEFLGLTRLSLGIVYVSVLGHWGHDYVSMCQSIFIKLGLSVGIFNPHGINVFENDLPKLMRQTYTVFKILI